VLGPVVESDGRSTNTAHDVLGKPTRLPGDCVSKLGARGDVAQSMLRLVAGEHSVRKLERPRARERFGHEALELTARGELGGDALEDAVADERPRNSSGNEPASARSTTRAISGADSTSSTASSSGPRYARAAALAGKKAARPAASANPDRCSSSLATRSLIVVVL
jgi:hypothetical protein